MFRPIYGRRGLHFNRRRQLMTNYDARYLEGIRLFNDFEFFDAHDVWEELWADYQGPSRKFYQGLIQVAVCLVHFTNGNIHGARKLFDSSRIYLEPYRPFHEGIDLDKLLSEFQSCCEVILGDQEEQWLQAELDPDLIPEIHLEERETP